MKTEDGKIVLWGEIMLAISVVMNALGVLLMLHSGSGISAISSVPYAMNLVFPQLTLGTWTYLFQGALVLVLMIMSRRFVPEYLFSFVVGFAFGEMMDVWNPLVDLLPQTLPLQVAYFVASYVIISFGIALANRSQLPITPTDLFPRDLSALTHIPYARVKIGFDVACLAATLILTLVFLGHIQGLGIGTVVAAFTMGKGIALAGELYDKHFVFRSFLSQRRQAQPRSAH